MVSHHNSFVIIVLSYFVSYTQNVEFQKKKITNPFTSVKFINISKILVFLFVFGSVLNLNLVNLQTIESGCGTINIPKGLTIEENQTHKGFWPFAVAIYEIKEHRPFCGGTLISKKHVLTAAHCIQDQTIGVKYSTDEIAVLLGAYTLLAKSESGVKHANVTEIRVHPEWEKFSKASLSNSATLTNDIQVVCLPSDDDLIVDAKAFIVGWDLVQQTPKHSIINSFNNSYCNTESLSSSLILSRHTFCGVADAEVSLIKKISGGGFFIRLGSAWVQHGIGVSVTNATGDFTGQEIVILTNVTSFKHWIAQTVRQSGDVVGEAIKGTIDLGCEFIDLYYSYACVAHSLDVLSTNFAVDSSIGSHKSDQTNDNVELVQFHNGTLLYLVNGLGKLFPNLKSIFVGYSDSLALNTKLISRSNFHNMENVFEIVIHRSGIETMSEDTLWDLPNLERFQLDGKLKELPERTFENNAKLKEVYLASNALEFLPRLLFKNNLNLNWVNFQDNSLKFIETDFMRLESIKYIFLAGNICINKNFNRTDNQIEDQLHEDQTNNTNILQVGRIMELQRLIYSNCSFIP